MQHMPSTTVQFLPQNRSAPATPKLHACKAYVNPLLLLNHSFIIPKAPYGFSVHERAFKLLPYSFGVDVYTMMLPWSFWPTVSFLPKAWHGRKHEDGIRPD